MTDWFKVDKAGLARLVERRGKSIVLLDAPERRQERIKLLIHELAHHWGHHLEEGYHRALEKIGARLVEVALSDPKKLEDA